MKADKKSRRWERRDFLKGALSATVAMGIAPGLSSYAVPQSAGNGTFKLKYAPHFGMFKNHTGDDPVDHSQLLEILRGQT